MHLIFGALRSILVRCKHYVTLPGTVYLNLHSYVIYLFCVLLCAIDNSWCEARFRHALTAEMFKTLSSGGTMHASVKLEGIDGRAPQERVEHVA